MDSIVEKWDKEIKEKGILNIIRYIKKQDIKAIDLKYLREIDNICEELDAIIIEVNKERYGYEDVLCAYPNGPYYTINKCSKYDNCILCVLDHLISINRIKIIV